MEKRCDSRRPAVYGYQIHICSPFYSILSDRAAEWSSITCSSDTVAVMTDAFFFRGRDGRGFLLLQKKTSFVLDRESCRFSYSLVPCVGSNDPTSTYKKR